VGEPFLQVSAQRQLAGFDIAAGLLLGDEASALDLSLALGAAKAVPAAPALAGRGIGGIDDNGPMAGATRANMALDADPPLN
jgi:hypothetical protein